MLFSRHLPIVAPIAMAARYGATGSSVLRLERHPRLVAAPLHFKLQGPLRHFGKLEFSDALETPKLPSFHRARLMLTLGSGPFHEAPVGVWF